MSRRLRLVIAQLDFLVGDIWGNAGRIVDAARRAREGHGAQLVVFPELALTGYPPEDLLLRPEFDRQVRRALAWIAQRISGTGIILGHPWEADGARYNAASYLAEGRRQAMYFKQCLPNYGVFDEKRYFAPGRETCLLRLQDLPVGLTICEDIWEPEPAARAAEAGARLLININASPYHVDRGREREAVVAGRARAHGLAAVYVNLVGGQDELVFDGQSFAVDRAGQVVCRTPAFTEGLFPVDVDLEEGVPVPGEVTPALPEAESVYRAIVLGVRDYVNKNGFPGVVIGLSGGVDSALTLALAVDALGPERVEALMMPSRYTADMSLEDARAEAEALGVQYRLIPIEPMFQAFLDGLKEEFGDRPMDVTEENIQARIRGVILMAVSNKTGRMVLTTGNKSEMAVGYATLYGDMAGGFGAIKDVPKTLVYRLARYRNGLGAVIPERVLTRAPSAELAPGQKDTDSLPPYEILDAILERYVEQDQSVDRIIAGGFDAETVRRVARMVDRNEYKRRQAAPGVRVTRRAFGRDRRYPITSGYGRQPPPEDAPPD